MLDFLKQGLSKYHKSKLNKIVGQFLFYSTIITFFTTVYVPIQASVRMRCGL